jgi:hypothetical protein
MHHRRVLLLVAVLACFISREARTQPAPPPRTAEQREKLAALLKRVHAVAALNPLTPEAAMAALGAKFGPPKQIKADRREWKLQPSDLYVGGLIMQAGTTVVVTVAPSPAIGLVFEDLTASLQDRPYYWYPVKQPYKGVPRVWVVEHIFQVTAGQLRLQIFPTIPPDDPQQVVKAEVEAKDMVAGLSARQWRVISFSLSNLTPRRDPATMKPLSERRRTARRARSGVDLPR